MREHIVGVTVSDTSADIATATLRVTANSRNRRPTIPPMRSTGTNTASSETVIDTIVKPICLAPSSAASRRPMPRSMPRMMFSVTTMASSTTNPVEMVSAISDRLSMLYPSSHMMPSVARRDSGIATVGTIVARGDRRKPKTTRMTSATLIASVFSTSKTEDRIVAVRSLDTSSSIVGDTEVMSVGSTESTRSFVSRMFASGCLKTMMRTARSPSAHPATRLFSTSS